MKMPRNVVSLRLPKPYVEMIRTATAHVLHLVTGADAGTLRRLAAFYMGS